MLVVTGRGLHSKDQVSELFRRALKADVLCCERCGGRLEVIAYLTESKSIKASLDATGTCQPLDLE